MNTPELISLWSLMLDSPNVDRELTHLMGVMPVRTLSLKDADFRLSLYAHSDHIHATGHGTFDLLKSDTERLAAQFDSKPEQVRVLSYTEIAALL